MITMPMSVPEAAILITVPNDSYLYTIHLTRKGYMMKGDLFFNAFVRSNDDHVEHIPL